LPADDDFLRDMSANVSHRRGRVVDDTCFRCGQRVYLLERHLTTTGQLFHRHCYRDSERSATLQRASTRHPTPSRHKENLLPSEVTPTTRRVRRKSSSTSIATNIESTSAERRGADPANGKSPEVKIRRVTGAVKSSGVAERKVAEASVTANKLAAPTTCFRSDAKLVKSVDNETSWVTEKPSAQTAKHLNSPQAAASSAAACLTADDRSTKTPKQTMDAAAVDESSATENTSAMRQRSADATRYTRRSTGATVTPTTDHQETYVSTIQDRARPAQSATSITAAKTTSPAAVSTANVSLASNVLNQPSTSSIDRSCDIIPGTEPSRFVLQHLAPKFSSEEKQKETAISNGGHKSKDCLTSTTTETNFLKPQSCLSNDPISRSFTGYESSSDRDSLSDVSWLPAPASQSYQAAFILPDSSNTGVSRTRLNKAVEPKPSEPLQIYSSDCEPTSPPAAHYSSAEKKQNDLSSKIRTHLYRPKSLENLIEPSYDKQTHKTIPTLHKDDNERDTTFESTSRPTTRSVDDNEHRGPQCMQGRQAMRPKFICNLPDAASQSRIDDDKTTPGEARRNAAETRNKLIVAGIVENLTNIRQRKQQDAGVATSKEPATKTRDGIISVGSRYTVTTSSKQPPQQTAAAKRNIPLPPDTSQPSAFRLPTTASKQNQETSVTSPLPSCEMKTLKSDDNLAEFVGKKTRYVSRWQAELQRRRGSQEGQPLQFSDSSARKNVGRVKYSPPVSAAVKNCNLSSKFSKSVGDLSQIAAAAAETVDERRGVKMTDWQLEVERRKAARCGRYVDPEKPARSQRHNVTTHTAADMPIHVRKSMFELNRVGTTSGSTDGDRAAVVNSRQRELSPRRRRMKSNLSLSVDNLATCHLTRDTSRSKLRLGLISPELNENSDLVSTSAEVQPGFRRSSIITGTKRTSTAPSDSLTENLYESIDDIHNSLATQLDNPCQVTELLFSIVIVLGDTMFRSRLDQAGGLFAYTARACFCQMGDD